MAEVKLAGMGETVWTRGAGVLGCIGLGSCVGTLLFDPRTHTAALAHVMLPEAHDQDAFTLPGKYATTAVPALLRLLDVPPALASRLKAILVGGGELFQNRSQALRIGERNVEALHKLLSELRIGVVFEHTRGSSGRSFEFEHTIFALPFALLSLLYAAEGVPSARVVGWILVAMVSARTAAMAFNRIVDRDIDALNPRTRARALPAGLLTLRQMGVAMGVSMLLFLYAAWQLNWVCFALAPVALGVILGYSYSKRFTPLSHYWLGLSLGIAPSAVWIAVRGTLEPAPLWLTLGVALWVAGFDILYSLQDEAFDRAHGLRSLPQTLGAARAIQISRVSHALCIVALLIGGVALGAGAWYYAGVAFAALMLAYEQSLVKPNDLSRLNLAFFTMNGYVSIGLFGFALLDRVF